MGSSMTMLLTMSVAAALAEQTPAEPPPQLRCPLIVLAAAPPRAVTLEASDVGSWRGPFLELKLSVTAAEAQSFGKLAFIRLAGIPLAGGTLSRLVDEQGAISLRLALTTDQLAMLTQGGTLELVEREGPGLNLTLAAADVAPLASCLAASAPPITAANLPFMHRSWTFVPLQPNSPVTIRTRGNVSMSYPPNALAEDREGVSRVAVTIGPDGRIDSCTVIVSSGHADLDDASCRAARRSTYFPATDAKAEPVETKAEQNLVWKTEG